MKKNKSPIEKRHLLQLLSLLAAIILWFAITYAEDPSISISINNIPLKTSGENILEQNGLIFVNRDKIPGISLELRGKRSDINSVLNSVTAKIDLSDITESGEYSRELTFDIPNSSVIISRKKTPAISVTIEKSVSKDVPVYIQQVGTERNKEYLVKSTPDTEKININGAQGDISKIKEIFIPIDVGNMTDDNSGEYPIAYGGSGHSIVTPENKVKVNAKSITVKNTIYYRKSADIALDPNIDISGYQVIVKSFSRDNVEIGVANSDYDIKTVYADFATGISSNSTGKYQMKLIIPDDVYCPTKDDELIMNADIENITTEEVTLNISAENVPDGLFVTLNPASVTVNLTGAQSKIKEIKAKVDLSGLEKGTFNVPVVFVTENTGVTADSSPYISVTLE